ncbi:hypothetical protein ACOMHN_011156 [Nucella lapillus]
MMAFADQSHQWLVLPSLITLSYGGVSLLLTNVQISCLFPQAAGVIVTLVSGAFDFSAATQLAVKMLYESGLVSRLYSYVGLAGLHFVMVLISTLCFLPKGLLAPEADENTSHTTPQQQPDFRKRRDSLYDWSEINVHSNHHGFRCSSCEDSNSDGEQRELATNHAAGFETHPQNGFPKQLDEKEVCKDIDGFANVFGSEINQSSNAVPSKTTLSHSQGGRHDSKNILSTISETVEKAEPAEIKMTSFGGKFISVISIGSPRSQPKKWEGREPWCAKDGEEKADGVHNTCDCEGVIKDGGKVHTNGLHKVTLDLNSQESWSEGESNEGKEDIEVENEGQDKGDMETLYPTLKKSLQSAVFWLHVLWFSINVLRLVAFFGFINTKLTRMFHGEKEKVSFFTNVQAYFILGIMGICWISGALYDWQTSLFKGRKKRFEREVLPGALPLALTSLLGVAISAAWMIDSETALYIMFSLLVFYNAFIFGICLSFTLKVFPERYFGILNGVVSIIAGAVCFFQYAIFIWHESYPEGAFHAEIFMLTLVVLSLVHPVYIVYRSLCPQIPVSSDPCVLRSLCLNIHGLYPCPQIPVSSDPCVLRSLCLHIHGLHSCPQIPVSSDPCVLRSLCPHIHGLYPCPQIPVSSDPCVLTSMVYTRVLRSLCPQIPVSSYPCVLRSLCPQIPVSSDPCVFTSMVYNRVLRSLCLHIHGLYWCPQIPVSSDPCVFTSMVYNRVLRSLCLHIHGLYWCPQIPVSSYPCVFTSMVYTLVLRPVCLHIFGLNPCPQIPVSSDPCVLKSLCPQIPVSSDPCVSTSMVYTRVLRSLCPQIPVSSDPCVSTSMVYTRVLRSPCPQIPVSSDPCVLRSLSSDPCVLRSLCPQIPVTSDPCVLKSLCPQIPVSSHPWSIPVSSDPCVSTSMVYTGVLKSLCPQIPVSSDPCVFRSLCPQIPVSPHPWSIPVSSDPCVFKFMV